MRKAVTVYLPNRIYEQIKVAADIEKISLSSFILFALMEKMS